ncbi:hypothetical protein ACSFA3_01945 [Variovorax sp. RHLX14]|uniref:hypothetical protein n=1 Tax=Variovorax sp. RHLX14 TaxID=1259731 RepID=UPI003F4877AA
MGIALLTFVDLLAPLQSLACRWMPKKDMGPTDRSAGLRYVSVRPACTARSATGSAETVSHESNAPAAVAAAGRPAARPLRVVRTVDAHQAGQTQRRTGRVILSGRLVDVCAELDRLAALEAAEISHGVRVLH